MSKSFKQLNHIERVSRRTRHHQIYLNQKQDEKFYQNLNNLVGQYEQTRLRLKASVKLEKQRKDVLNITIEHISNDRKRHSLSINTKQIKQKNIQKLPKINPTEQYTNKNLKNLPSSPIKLSPVGTQCRLFSKNCQLYPCQPVYEYTSFNTKDHDQTLRRRNSSGDSSHSDSSSSNLQELVSEIKEQKYEPDRRQLALTIDNQYHLANRHNFMARTKTNLDAESRLLQERLAEKTKFDHDKDYRINLKPAIQRHLKISAKFCA
ncbi:unnamed protein product [Rotaria magnacalcarata]|uniref:Uncharacterized protein n=1 Tax=Rotaria magnacalcarata TaxID=392030 RepID=A0A815BUQ5_9BILA|nr:unnamed protein product [Rotaria magnacalcarata]CAF2061766.1 unnamed protein product [Rotaria magnacalcarata]CAF3817229.1 unnamed protein product [Rotaria magnacalcarata]